MDDFTLGGEASAVAMDVAYLRRASKDIGLIINDSKREIIHDPNSAQPFFALLMLIPIKFHCWERRYYKVQL